MICKRIIMKSGMLQEEQIASLLVITIKVTSIKKWIVQIEKAEN